MSLVLPLLAVLLAIEPDSSINSAKSFEQIDKEADAARAAYRLNDAVNLYREGVRLRPTWGEGWWSLGSLLYDEDRFPEAEAAFRRFVLISPKTDPAYAFLGLCEYETRDYDLALRHFRSWATAGWPGTPQLIDVAVFHFASLLTRDGEFVQALYLLATQAAKMGENPALTEAMGLASLRIRNVPEDYPPEHREMVWLAGEAAAYAAQSPHDFARADYYADRLLSRYPEQPEVHYLQGTLFTFESKTAEAEREYRQELRISPQHVSAMLALVNIDLGNNHLSEAESLAKRAIEIEPKNPEAHHALGRVMMATNHFSESASELETAKRLGPDVASIRSHLAMVYGRLGRQQDAKAEADAYLSLKNHEEVLAPQENKVRHASVPEPPK